MSKSKTLGSVSRNTKINYQTNRSNRTLPFAVHPKIWGGVKKILITTCFICFFLTAHQHAEASPDDVEKCKYAYIKIEEYVFKISRKHLGHMEFKEESVYANCKTSISNPLTVDRFSFRELVNIPEYKGKVPRQYILQTKGKTYGLETIKNELSKQNLSIKNLPKEGSFYKYYKFDRQAYPQYIANHPRLTDYMGNPLVFSPPSLEGGYFDSSLAFWWKENLFLKIRSLKPIPKSMPKPKSIEAWVDVFPVIIKSLESHNIEQSGEQP